MKGITRWSGFQKLSFGVCLNGFMFVANFAGKTTVNLGHGWKSELSAGMETFWGDCRKDASLRFELRCFWRSLWKCRRWDCVGLASWDGRCSGMERGQRTVFISAVG
jgi:hypothetical protein